MNSRFKIVNLYKTLKTSFASRRPLKDLLSLEDIKKHPTSSSPLKGLCYLDYL